MKPIHVRQAHPFDAGALCTLLGKFGHRIARADLRDWIDDGDIWMIAEVAGATVGFQWAGPADHLPREACDIATFIDPASSDIGIGSALFAATRSAAAAAGWRWITASVPADNIAAQSYYRSRSFETLRDVGEDIAPGDPVPPVRMIYRLG